jgi:hypothetical protein
LISQPDLARIKSGKRAGGVQLFAKFAKLFAGED